MLCFLLLAFGLAGCGNEAARNRNAQIVANYNKEARNNNLDANNANNTNTNSNVNSEVNSAANLAEEEVPDFEDAQEALKKGDEYLDANATKNAINAYTQSVELEPDLAEAHFKLGVAHALLESEEDSKPKIVDANSNTNTGAKAKKSKKVEKKNSEKAFENAVKAYKRFIRKNPKDAQAYYNLGRAHNKLFDDIEAERALQKAVRLDPEESLYRTELGAVLIKLAKYPSAISQLKKALDLDEDNFRAEDLLVEARAGRKRTDFKTKRKPKK